MPRFHAIAIALLALPLWAQEGSTKFELPGIRKLTFGGQYRLRYEGLFDYDLDRSAGSAASNDYFTQRVRLNFGLDLSDDLGAFVQLQDAREWGEEMSTTDDSADGFDLHQGYVDLRKTPGIGGSTRVGRQEINLGDQRLVGALDWKSGARSLDGVLQSWAYDGGGLHFWALQAREMINATNDDAQFAGAYYTRTFDEGVDGDFYVMYLHDDGVAPGAIQNRGTLGTRWIVKCCDPLSFGAEVATQFGDVGAADIPIGETYAGHIHGTYAGGGTWNPRFTLALDVASGDDPNTTDNERFNNLFPTAHAHWGMMDLALWENLFNPWARVQVATCERSDLSFTWLHLEAMEAGDAFRGPSGALAPMGSTSKKMGEEFDLLYSRRLAMGENVKTSVQVGYGVFVPGSGAKAVAGSDDPAHFLYAQFDVKF